MIRNLRVCADVAATIDGHGGGGGPGGGGSHGGCRHGWCGRHCCEAAEAETEATTSEENSKLFSTYLQIPFCVGLLV